MFKLFMIFLTPDFFSIVKWLYIVLHFEWQNLIGMLAKKNAFRRKEKEANIFGKCYSSEGTGKSVMKGIIEVRKEI